MQTFSSRICLLALALCFFFACPPPVQTCTGDECVAGTVGGGDGTLGGGAGGGGETGGGTGGGEMMGGGTGGGEMGGGAGGAMGGGAGGAMGGGAGGGVTGGGGGMTGGGGGMTGGGGGMTGGGTGMAVTGAETCTPGNPIATDVALLSQTLAGLADDYQWSGQPGCTASGTFGPDTTYPLSIPAGHRVTITATPDGAWDPSLQLATSCAAGESNTCLAGVNSEGDGVAEVLAFANPGNTALNTFLIVDTFSPSPTGFVLDVSFAPIAPGDTCSTTASAGAGAFSGTLVGSANDYASGPGCAVGSDGPDSVWTVSVPPGNRLTATVTANGTSLADGGTTYDFQPTVNFVVRSCTPTLSCSGGAAAVEGGGTATGRFDNLTGSAMPVLVVIDSARPVPTGSYTLSNTLAPFNLPPGDVCGNVGAPLTVDTVLMGETLIGYANHFSTGTDALGCALADGPDRVYAVTVPPGTRLTTTASHADSDLSLSVLEGAAAACLASPLSCDSSADRGFVGAETATYDNPSAAAKTVFVIVDRSALAPINDVFDFTVSLTPVPLSVTAGETCASAATISANTTLVSTTTGLMNDFSAIGAGPCRMGSAAPDAVFQTTVPANSRLTVTTTASWGMSLNVLSAPTTNCGGAMGAGMVCLAGSDEATDTQSVTVTNADLTAPLTVFILIDGFLATDSGAFELSTSVSAIPPAAYTRTTVPQACMAMTGASALLSTTTTPVSADEAVSATTALTFPFSFFGAGVTHYAVTNNGLLHFFAAAGSVASSEFNNVPIPGSAAPNGFAAPFWDDLNSVPTTTIQTLTTGTAPNRRLTVEWFDATFYGTGRPERLQFQVQLFETTNVIEFHYCGLAANGGSGTDVTGSSATIGLESSTGTEGVQHSSNAAGSLDITNALRFTP